MLAKIGAVVVLDLDDTLYKEYEYRNSGIDKTLSYLEDLYGELSFTEADRLSLKLNSDWLRELCIKLKLPSTVKESLLWVYRLHQPSIKLGLDVQNVLIEISKNSQLAILTDGRSLTQRQKIKALGLSHLPIYISEEYEYNKPAIIGFELIMRDIPAEKYFYVGDNLMKDFIAPNSLGWTSVCLRDNGNNIHSQNVVGLNSSQLPKIWIDTLSELLVYIC